MRPVNKAFMPASNAILKVSNKTHSKGRGVGAVLLDGGKGGQSSYSSLDDYINTTGINPLSAPKPNKGLGLESMNTKIKSLMVKSRAAKPKNINFNL